MKKSQFYIQAMCLMGAVAFVSACSENTLVDENVTESKTLTSISATMPTDATSRVTFTDGTSKMSQVWKTGDNIIINTDQSSYSNVFTLDKGAESASGATFKGDLPYTGTQNLYAYYPGSNWTKGSTSQVMAFNFAKQDGTLEGLANYAVMAGVATTSAPTFEFHNMTTLMKFVFTFPTDVTSAAEYNFTQAKMYNNGKPIYNSGATHVILWYPQDKNTYGGITVTLPDVSTPLTEHHSTVYFAMPAAWWANSAYQQVSTKNLIIKVPVGSGYYAGIINKDQLLEPGKMYTVNKSLVAAQYANAEATTFTDNETGDFWLIDNADANCLAAVTSALKALTTANSSRKITLVDANLTYVPQQFAQSCTNLAKAYFPAATGEIPYMTFYGCTSLTTFSAPYATSVGTINNNSSSNVFFHCTALTNVDIPNVTTIGTNAFTGCSALASINLPKVTSIGDLAFENCSALTEISLPMLQNLDGGVFDGCTNLTKITLGGGTGWDGFLGIGTGSTNSVFNNLGTTNKCSLYLPAGQTVDAKTKKWTVLLKGGSTQEITVTSFLHVYVGTNQIF